MVGACDSPWLLRLREILDAQSERYRRLSVPLAEIVRDLNREHRDIMKVALARDAGRVKALMTLHLDPTTRVLLEQLWLADAPPGPPPAHSTKTGRGQFRLTTSMQSP